MVRKIVESLFVYCSVVVEVLNPDSLDPQDYGSVIFCLVNLCAGIRVICEGNSEKSYTGGH